MAEMTTETFKGEIETFMGEPVNPKLKFEGTYQAYKNYADVSVDEKLSEKDMLKIVNDARKTTERAKRMAEVLKENGYEKPDMNTPEAQRNLMVKSLMKQKPNLTIEVAGQIIDGILNS